MNTYKDNTIISIVYRLPSSIVNPEEHQKLLEKGYYRNINIS